MSVFEYYFYPPKNPQFFFPKKKFKTYQKFYKPFSIKSKMFWFLFKNIFLVRIFFKIKERKIPLPISTIKKIIGLKEPTLFLNLGTRGIEQKATIIADNGKAKRFLKFAQNSISKQMVANEAKILKKLENQNKLKTARVINYVDNKDFTYIVTDVISGQKASFIKLNGKVFELLCVLGDMYPLRQKNTKEMFSHGDFCPWNMLVENNQEIVLIDWEMAGFKPLGYDLFTYIFQTNFLLHPNKSLEGIFLENKNYIYQYFKRYKIDKYNEHIVQFAKLKVKDEEKKESSKLLSKYQELLESNGL